MNTPALLVVLCGMILIQLIMLVLCVRRWSDQIHRLHRRVVALETITDQHLRLYTQVPAAEGDQ
jgi:hypothetical protein